MRDGIDIGLARLAEARELALMSRDLVETGLGWSWTAPRIATDIRSPDDVVITARVGRRIAGFAIMHYLEEEASLNLLAVRPAHRRAGVGRRLVEWLEQTALVAGVSIVYLEVRATNDGARKFYERLGYRRVAYVPGYYGGREAAVRMGIDLWCARVATRT